MPRLLPPEAAPAAEERTNFDLNLQHGHKDLVQAVAFNTYGDRCATGSVDGKIRVFNRHKDGMWRICDTWAAHGGEIVELQWLPATIYPNLLASLGIEGRFKLWAEDPSAPPGRRFAGSGSSSSSSRARPAFDTRSSKGVPYRSFSAKHADPTRHTYLALLDAHGRLTVYEADEPEAIAECVAVDEFSVCTRPARGEEVSFRVRFDPNPEVCYNAVRAGVSPDALSLIVAGMRTVRVYRSRDVVAPTAYGVQQAKKEFYLAVEVGGPDLHRGLVRDVAWCPGNIRGYDMVATACQDGFVRVFRIDTPFSAEDDGKSWAVADLVAGHGHPGGVSGAASGANTNGTSTPTSSHHHAHAHGRPASAISASLAKPGTPSDRNTPEVTHTVREISRLDSHRTPVWRVGFDDDGVVLGSVGDDGRLVCYRQMPSGQWAKSSELGIVKARMVAP